MATSLFEIPEWLDYADFDNYPSEENPTTNADFINYARNQNKLVGALVAAVLWQPNTNFIAGKIIISPNMPEGMEAVALTGGATGTAEPAWESGTEEYQDSGVKWKLRYKHWSKSVEEISDLTTGATNRLPNKAYAVGNVVYVDSNLSVALKCTTAGTTSNTELDISGVSVGSSVEDGSVVWEVVSRDTVATIDQQRPIKTFTSLAQLGLDETVTIEEICRTIPKHSILILNVQQAYQPNLIVGGHDGQLTVMASNINRITLKYATATKGTFIASYADWVTPKFSGWEQLATMDDFAPSVSQRNGYYRGKNLGTIASVADADAFNTAHGLSAGTFDDIFVGDEITIKDGTYNAVWLVAGIDWDYNKGDTASGHGILLIPKAPLYNDQMNSTNVTTGGYKGSAMHTTKLPALVTKLQTVLGSHLKKRRVLISNSVNTSIASMAGEGWTGASNGWEWVDIYAVLPSEVEVYGSTVFSSSFRDVGEACQKLPIFNFINPVYFSRWALWLRAVASSPNFCVVGSHGHAHGNNASNSFGVRPLIYLA